MSFSNEVATTNTDSTLYVFSLQLQVPKDIYVGFSAQGGGWTTNASDYWARGLTVLQGVSGTAGEYYYGAVSGGELTTVYPIGDGTFGSLEILAQPVQITEVEVVTGQVSLAFTSLPIYATNFVERSDSASGTNWRERGMLPLGESSSSWSESNTNTPTSFYRVKSH